MRLLGNRVITVLVAVVLLVGAGDVASYATTGHGLLLGKANSSKKATTIARTTAGPAFGFRSRAGSPPFSVNSGTRVNGLNADRLDGLDSTSLQTRTRVFEDQGAQNRGSQEIWATPVSAGSYLVRYTAPLVLSAGTAAAPEPVACAIQSGGASYASTSGVRTGPSAVTFLSGSASITVAPGATPQLFCTTMDATTFALTDGGVVRIELTRIDALTRTTISGTG
jgi:hypothetical protein